MKLKQFVCKAASIAMCAMIIGTTVVSVNVKADTKATESTVALDTHRQYRTNLRGGTELP